MSRILHSIVHAPRKYGKDNLELEKSYTTGIWQPRYGNPETLIISDCGSQVVVT